MADISPELRAFLKAWLDWAESGAPDWDPFCRVWGLCSNARLMRCDKLMHEFLLQEFGPQRYKYPFGGPEEFSIRDYNATQHENPARLAWVRAKLGVTP